MANVTLKRPATSVVVSKGLAALQSLQEGEPMSKNALQFMKDWVAKQPRAGWEFPMNDYNSLKTSSERNTWRRQLAMDLSGSFLMLKEEKSIRLEEKKESLQGWCHLRDVAHHSHIAFDPANEDTMQLLFERVEGLPSRRSEIPKWAAKGHMQYYFAATQLEYRTTTDPGGLVPQSHGQV